MNLAQARHTAFAKARAAKLPLATKTILAQIEQEGRDDFEHEGDAAMNPYMGHEGDAWAVGYWAAKRENELA